MGSQKVVAVEGGGGRASNRVPSNRYARPETAIVKMDEVPEPPPRNRPVAEQLYLQVRELGQGNALKASFESEKHGEYVRGKMRAMAKKEKKFLSSSRTADGKTRYFWLEKL
jgi:hypothetical protein